MQDPFALVVGQPDAVTALKAALINPVHAYLFVGPAGSGKQDAARAFAAGLLNDPRPLRDVHPDVVTVEREGASINVAQAREISRLANLSPVEGKRKVLILTEFHLVEEAAPALLKTIEEATASTTFVILADALGHDLATIASRCVQIEFRSINPVVIAERLMNEGVESERAQQAAASAFGNMTRARILAADDSVVARHQLWETALVRLDGTGSASARLTDEILDSLDHATEPLVALLQEQALAMKTEAKETGMTATAAKTVEASQKRQVRRLRTDELRAGFSILSDVVAKRLANTTSHVDAKRCREQLAAINWANDGLQFNPGEALLLQGLFTRLAK